MTPVPTTSPAAVRIGGWLAGACLVALAAVVLAALAYVSPQPLHLTIGDERSDKGVVRDFYEWEPRGGAGPRYRWTRGYSSIVLPAWGTGSYRLTTEMGAPLNPEPAVRVLANGQEIGRTRLSSDFRPYTFEIPAAVTGDGNLTLAFESATFSPPNDRRRLGITLYSVALLPTADGWSRPPAGALGTAIGLALLAYATLAVAGWGIRATSAGALGLVAALAALLAWQRLFIVPVLGELLWIGGLALGATALLRLGLAGLDRAGGGVEAQAAGGGGLPHPHPLPEGEGTVLSPRPLGEGLGVRESRSSPRGPQPSTLRTERAWLLTIVAAALLVRLAATFHPQMDIIDLGFHVNRLTDVADRGQLFLKVRSAEWGGRETTYSPAAYLAMAPLRALVPDKHRLVRLFTALLETSRLLLVWALARWASGSGRAGLLAAALFVSLPLGVLPFSWGIASNLFGEWWATALLLTLAVGWERLKQPAVAGLAVLAATLALLSHPGVLLLTGAWLTLLTAGLVGGLLWRRARKGLWEREEAARVATLAGVAVLAAGLAFALFYRVDAAAMLTQGGSTIAGRLTGAPGEEGPRRWRVSGPVDDKTLGIGARYVTEPAQVLPAGLAGLAREAWAYTWAWPLPAAALGWWALGGTPRGRHARRLTLAWAGTALLFWLVGLLLNLYVRYLLFLLPVVAALAGVGLDRLARRGRAGVALATLLMAATVAAGLWLWHSRIVYFFH